MFFINIVWDQLGKIELLKLAKKIYGMLLLSLNIYI